LNRFCPFNRTTPNGRIPKIATQLGGRPRAYKSKPTLGAEGRKKLRWGFTLVELLTVLAIIGILATLLMSALSTAKKKSRIVGSISNLRQIAIAFTTYQDDYDRRPRTWDQLLAARYLGSPKVLKCLEDRKGNWGNLVQPNMTGLEATNTYSYLYPLPWDDWAWNRVVKSGPHAGLAACQLHGIGRPDPEVPSMLDYEGLVLRAQLDGAVVRREVFWTRPEEESVEFDSAPAASIAGPESPGFAPPMESSADDQSSARVAFTPEFPWALFMDNPLTNENLPQSP